MARKINCERFGAEQFVAAVQVRTIYDVRIATPEERKENQGIGCIARDVLSGEEHALKMGALIKKGLRHPNGEKVLAVRLVGGNNYILIGAPASTKFGVFIVPGGQRYEYYFNGRKLNPGTCILCDGKKTYTIGWNQFRKQFIMQPNRIAKGEMKGANNRLATRQHVEVRQPSVSPFVKQDNPRPVVQKQNIGFDAVLTGMGRESSQSQRASQAVNTGTDTKGRYVALKRIIREGTLVGLVLANNAQQVQVPLNQCIVSAANGEISNIKAVTRNGTTFLMGNGIVLESLPFIQV